MSSGRFWSVIFLLVVQSYNSIGFVQELRLYLTGGNSLLFDTHVPDLSKYSELLPQVHRSCSVGKWATFGSDHYNSMVTLLGFLGDTTPHCENVTGSSFRSLRYMGASDTDQDAISLYAGVSFDSTETVVVAKAFTGISHKIGSLAATGKTGWTLFEGQALDGKSICYRDSRGQNYDAVVNLNMTTVGSVFKGCDAAEIRTYRNAHFL